MVETKSLFTYGYSLAVVKGGIVYVRFKEVRKINQRPRATYSYLLPRPGE